MSVRSLRSSEGATMEGNEPREEAISSSLDFRPDFVSSGVTDAQINKFKDLQQRRLQMKASIRFKHQKSSKVNTRIVEDAGKKEAKTNTTDSEQGYVNEVSVTSDSKIKKEEPQANVKKKRQKLHWGLTRKKDGKGKPTCNLLTYLGSGDLTSQSNRDTTMPVYVDYHELANGPSLCGFHGCIRRRRRLSDCRQQHNSFCFVSIYTGRMQGTGS